MLLILLKKVIAYGDYETMKQTDYVIEKKDYAKIIKLQLAVVDEVNDRNTKYFDKGHFLYSTYHLNNKQSIIGRFFRTYYMLETLDRDVNSFSKEVQREYRNYYFDFNKKYGITTTQYEAMLFWELLSYYGINKLTESSLWRDIDNTYKGIKNRMMLAKILAPISVYPSELKEWALSTECEDWDFTKFQMYPFFRDDNNKYISISDYTLSNALFEKLFWLIRDCYSKDDSRAMAFYGRLFEKYVQEVARNATSKGYVFIEEFEIGKKGSRSKSSDAYLQKGNKLLAIEAKGFSVISNVMSGNNRVEDNYKKLFVNPVLEADKFLYKAFKENAAFMDIDEVYIIAVSMDNINANPCYYSKIISEIESVKKCSKSKYYFNLNIEEYEMLMYVLEKDNDIFALLKEYFKQEILPPFSNYLRNKITKIEMTTFMKECYEKAVGDVIKSLKENETV